MVLHVRYNSFLIDVVFGVAVVAFYAPINVKPGGEGGGGQPTGI